MKQVIGIIAASLLAFSVNAAEIRVHGAESATVHSKATTTIAQANASIHNHVLQAQAAKSRVEQQAQVAKSQANNARTDATQAITAQAAGSNTTSKQDAANQESKATAKATKSDSAS